MVWLLLGNNGKKWATFNSIIWSHWSHWAYTIKHFLCKFRDGKYERQFSCQIETSHQTRVDRFEEILPL